MQAQEWTPLLGVAVGGGLSYLAQFSTARLTGRHEDRRQAAQRDEARRTERLELLREFISLGQQGTRIAEERELAADWAAAGTPQWFAEARGLTDRLWVCERMIQVLFCPKLHQRARDYAAAVDRVLWREPDEIAAGGALWEVVQQPQRAFLASAHDEVG
jgi:hypothetical protein